MAYFQTDGNVRRIQPEDLQDGVVLREVHTSEPTTPPFGDAVISRQTLGQVTLRRPHMTFMGGQWIADVESVDVSPDRLCAVDSPYRVVLTSRGLPYRMAR